jgi:hypothetical protein
VVLMQSVGCVCSFKQLGRAVEVCGGHIRMDRATAKRTADLTRGIIRVK